jgi:hypothetical protein
MNQQPDKFGPAIYGGILMGLLSAIPYLNLVNCFCCAGILLGGFCAVFFYKSHFTPEMPPFTSGDCVMVGALAGLVGAVVGTVFAVGIHAAFGDVMNEFFRRALLDSNLELPSQTRAQLEEMLADKPLTPLAVSVSFFITTIMDVVFGLLGGLIGYGVFKPKVQGMPPMPKPQ